MEDQDMAVVIYYRCSDLLSVVFLVWRVPLGNFGSVPTTPDPNTSAKLSRYK